jgi:hypothetical protein
MDRGRIIAQGAPQRLVAEGGQPTLEDLFIDLTEKP